MQQITRGDYLKDLITIYIENNLQTDITELYNQFIFQCGEIQKFLTPAQVIKISFDEIESQLLKSQNTCYLAGITTDGHKETFNGSLTFNTRGEVVYYEPPVSTVTPAATETNCDCQGLRGFFSNCSQPAIKAYFSLNYVPTKLSELTNDTDFQDSVQVAESISIHNASTDAHPYIQDLIATEASLRNSQTEALGVRIDEESSLRASQTSALHGSIVAETTARDEAISLAISTTEAYADSSVSIHNSSTEAHPYIQSVLTSTTEALDIKIGDLDNLDTSVKSSVVNAINSEVTARENADNNLQGQIDGLAAASDVTDIVGTYQELQNYDTQHLNDNDIIKVLSDSTHDNQPSYYRFDKDTDTFSYIGSESAAYTKAQSDSIFVTQTTEINGHALSSDINLTPSDIGALADSYATVISANTSAIATNTSAIAANTTAIASNTSIIAQHTTAIASNTTDISTINGKIPTDASSSNKLVSASTLSASIADFANQDLSNLTSNGEARLHALKAYADEGELLTDADGLAFVEKYAHSTFDSSKFTVVGSPIVTSDGIASGFSSGNYILASNIDLTRAFKFTLKFTTGTINGTQYVYGSDNYCSVKIGNNKLLYSYNLIEIGVDCSPNTTYDVICEYDGNTTMILKYKTESATSYTINTRTVTKSNKTSYSTRFGITWDGVNQYFLGSIDLKQFSITVDGVEVFSGNKTGIDTIKPDDYTIVGTPAISTDGVVSGFDGDNDYITSGTVNVNTVGTVSIKGSAIFQSNSNNRQTIFETQGTSSGKSYKISLAFDGTKCYVIIYVQGTYTTTVNTNCAVVTGDLINFDIVLNKNSQIYNIYVNGNKISITDTSYNLSSFYMTSVRFSHGTYTWKGSIDLNAFKIYVDGNLVYQPCLKIPYTESKTGGKIVDYIYRDRVNDMAEQFGFAPYYTLQDEAKGNYTVVGSPIVTTDGIASGFSSNNYLTMPKLSSLVGSAGSWDLDIKFTTPNDLTTNVGYLLDGNTTWDNLIRITNSQIQVSLTSTNNSYNIASYKVVTTITPNTTYWLKLIFTGAEYLCKYSTNGTDFTTVNIATSSLKISDDATSTLIGVVHDFNSSWFFTGSIDLNAFKIYVDNKLAYEAVTEPNFTLPQVELYGLIGQRTLRDSYRNGINYWELYSNRDLEQGGSCTSGVEVTFARPFADTNYVLSVPYSAKSSTAFTPTQTGDWIAKGKGIL